MKEYVTVSLLTVLLTEADKQEKNKAFQFFDLPINNITAYLTLCVGEVKY